MSHPGANPSDRHKVVIIGSGFGGLTAAKALKKADVDIKMIARTTHHLFQPLLYQVATGIISEGEIAPATRVILRNQRREVVDVLKKMEKDAALSEDDLKKYTKEVQDITDEFIKKVDETYKLKEKEVLED